jgi:hypothetical protein
VVPVHRHREDCDQRQPEVRRGAGGAVLVDSSHPGQTARFPAPMRRYMAQVYSDESLSGEPDAGTGVRHKSPDQAAVAQRVR